MLNHQHEQIASFGHMLCKGEIDEPASKCSSCVCRLWLSGGGEGYRKFGSRVKGPPDGHSERKKDEPSDRQLK